MPQASHELRSKWKTDDTATRYLNDRGYRLMRNWTWDDTNVTKVTEEDLSAINYLISEWDFGGLIR